jgi:hypothetical protein
MGIGESEARVVSGRSWADFCDGLKEAGQVILRDASPRDPLDRAEGFRYLSRLVRTALEQYLEFADAAAPVFRRPSHETVKIGADNPDNHYQSAAVSGAYAYRIRGRRNTVHYLGIGTYAGGYGSAGRSGQTGYIDDATLAVGPDGRFEIVVSCDERPGNWLPMEPDSTTLIVRQTFADREREQVADLSIERLDGPARPPPLSAETLDRGLAAAAAYVRGTASLFTDWAEGFARRRNELPEFDPAVAAAAHGDPNICYFHGYWELADDEVLWIEVTPPACDYWNFQLNNHWMESLDYRYYRIALNHHQARLEPDGSLRIAVAHRDPGHPNWLETAGHRRGTMCLRWVGAKEHPAPATRLAKLGPGR